MRTLSTAFLFPTGTDPTNFPALQFVAMHPVGRFDASYFSDFALRRAAGQADLKAITQAPAQGQERQDPTSGKRTMPWRKEQNGPPRHTVEDSGSLRSLTARRDHYITLRCFLMPAGDYTL
jgi:hypothetical protein